MKSLKSVIIKWVFVIISISFINTSPTQKNEEVIGVIVKVPNPKNDFKQYLHDIGYRESLNNYMAVNSLGYLGKYQFGMYTLRDIGYVVSKDDFLNDAMLQDEAMKELLRRNKHTLSSIIEKYDSTHVNGNLVTESGILAGAHLGGSGNVKKYLKRKGRTNHKDAYGTSIGNYTHKFSGYEINF